MSWKSHAVHLSFFCVFLLGIFNLWQYNTSQYRTANHLPSLSHLLGKPTVSVKEQIRFWKALEHLLTSNAPRVPRPDQNGSQPGIYFDPKQPFVFEELTNMNEDQAASMKSAHESFLKAIKVHDFDLVYNKRTRGIVTTAGGPFLPLVVVMLRILQRIGSTLPLEVFLIAGDEYGDYICTQIFLALNARCVILSEILDTSPHPFEIRSFQLKAFALLFSSFEEVLFLDADSFPVLDPRRCFDSEPFKSAGFLTWPDFWFAAPSQHFFDITSLRRRPNNIRQSTGSGQIIISKRNHRDTLLIAAYYNYWGPEHYYSLLSQGGPGEGDKETWFAAAQVAGEPFYQVSEKNLAIEHADTNGYIVGSAMIQFDPAKDYRLISHGLRRLSKPGIAPSPKPLFVHVHFPKFNPGQIYDDERLLHWDNGTLQRAWIDDPSTVALFDMDVEKMYWRESKWVACTMEDRFRDWFGRDDVCRKRTEHWEAMFGDDP